MTDETRANHFRQLNQKPLPAVGERWEINANIYNEFTEMQCRPLGWTETSFYSAEFDDNEVTKKFTKDGDRYFCEFARYPGGLAAAHREMFPTDDDILAADRKEAGARINPATAETMWSYGQTMDPYGDDANLPDELQCVGRLYFARAPGGDWIAFCDLPEATRNALLNRESAA